MGFAVASSILISAVLAQRAEGPRQRLAFEVVSIKANNSGSFSSRSSSNGESGLLRASNVTVRSLIVQAYGLFDYQLVGGPDWMNTSRFDIQAKAPAEAIPLLNAPRVGIANGNRQNGMNQMIQSMLEDRFQLTAHRETRELPVFLLTVAKVGLKMQPTVEGRDGPGGLKGDSSRSSQTKAAIEMSGRGITMTRLANMLTGPAGRAILDRTNISGTYDFTLKFTDQATPTPGISASSTDPSGPSLFTVLQEQLGLKLEASRGPVEVLVIDALQPPSEN